ncbi:hypothetical protein AAC387_Pa01g2507 [Persea americana]
MAVGSGLEFHDLLKWVQWFNIIPTCFTSTRVVRRPHQLSPDRPSFTSLRIGLHHATAGNLPREEAGHREEKPQRIPIPDSYHRHHQGKGPIVRRRRRRRRYKDKDSINQCWRSASSL